jgi:ribosome-associated protein
LLVVNQLHSSLCAFIPPSNLLNKKLKIIINQFIEVTIMKEVSTKKLVETIVEGIQNRKGQRIVTVDLRKLKDAPAEYFIIAEGGSNVQVVAIADEVDSFVRTKTHVHPLGIDGRDNAEWIAMDYGTIFVHIMQREPRAYYDIEHLWADGKITEIPEV